MDIIAATQNTHKIDEIQAIVRDYGMTVTSRHDAGIDDFEIEETGNTFEENSYIKAKTILYMTDKPVIADDSGLEVDYLNGEPGVYSARYAGVDGASADSANNRKLLAKLQDVPEAERTARFVSVITLLFPDGREISVRGECEGRIAFELMGDNGFGYDPLFIPDGYEESFAQIHIDEKNKISHRARALQKLSEMLGEE
jgi:XTP/dITP diphosphohydrolase